MLRKLFNRVDVYYGQNSRHADAYDHVWTGIIIGFISAFFSWAIAGTIITIGWIVHVLIKELILDRNKRLSGDPHEKEAFVVDMITRNSGWILGAIILTVIKVLR